MTSKQREIRRKRNGFRDFFILLLTLATPTRAYCLSGSVQIEASDPRSSQSIRWDSSSAPIDAGSSPPLAQLHGVFSKGPNWNLVLGTQLIPMNQGAFQIRVPVTGPTTKFSIRAVDQFGKLEEYSFTLKYVGSWPDERASAPHVKPEPPRATRISLGAGFSSLEYLQGRSFSYTSSAITAKGNFVYRLGGGHWDLGASAYVTAMTLSSSRTDGVQARFLGVNLRAGYTLPFIADPWKVSLAAGGYYTTMFVTRNAFGYADIGGPQLFPVIRRRIGRSSSLGAYVKYSPIGSNFALLSLQNREFAVGGDYSPWDGNEGIPMSVTIDWSTLNLESSAIGQPAVVSNSLTFGVAFSI